jgi:hypothetical protein
MPVFAVFAVEEDKVKPAIEAAYPQAHKRAWNGLWFVHDEATAQEVAGKLGIPDGARGYAFVTAFANYWGWGPQDTWEWIALKRKPKAE